MKGCITRLVLTAVLAVTAWWPAAFAAEAGLSPAPYRPLPVGTVLDYGSWKCEVIESRGMDTVCADEDKRARVTGVFVVHGSTFDEGYAGLVRSLNCMAAGAGGLPDSFVSMDSIALGEDARSAIVRFWPLRVGNTETFPLRFGSHPDDRADFSIKVVNTEDVVIDGRRRTLFVVQGTTKYRNCGLIDTAFRQTWWYDPVEGIVVKSRRLWTGGNYAGLESRYEIAGFSSPDGNEIKLVSTDPMPAKPVATRQLTLPMRSRPAALQAKDVATPRPSGSAAFELAFWDAIKTSKKPADFKAYLRRYPDGNFADLVRIRLRSHQRPAQLAALPPERGNQPESDPFRGIQFGRYHALVIGNNAYRNLTKLETAANDARVVASLLKQDYGFETTLLLDGTRVNVIDALARYWARLKSDDNLLIYYAGRCALDKVTGSGHWLPVDATKDSAASWVSVTDVTTMLRAIRARHVMVVSDSCYSGTLVRAGSGKTESAAERVARVKRLLGRRGRTALTSGGLEPVSDSDGGGHSVFAKVFIETLRKNKGVLEGQRLFDAIKRPKVLKADRTPQYSDIRGAGHEGGDFMFVRQRR